MSILMKETKKQKVSSSMKNKEHPSAKKSTYENNNNSQGILNLHSSIGNQAIQKLLNATGIQAKLTLSSPSDSYEREADRVADEVMSMNDSKVQANSPITIQRKPESSSNTQELSSHTESKINSLHGRGEALSSQTRSFFEPRFRKDFSKVRVHTDSSANALASSINARAFTKGNHIVFGPSEYSPHSASGKRLLGHELTHVVQQGNRNISRVSRKEKVENKKKEALIALGKALYPIFLKLPPIKKFTLKLNKSVMKVEKVVESPLGLTIVGFSVLGFGLAYKYNLLNMRSNLVKQKFEIPQSVLGLTRKVFKYDFKYVEVSAQPILKGLVGYKPREYGVMIYFDIKIP